MANRRVSAGAGRARAATFAFVAILWLGVLIGVSFLATPVKFQAPSLDLPVALEVGRVTFALLARTEWALCAGLVLAALALPGPPRIFRWGSVAGLAAILVLQAVWLLPILDARVGQIIAGIPVASSSHHLFYIAAEALKALLLTGLGASALAGLTDKAVGSE